MNTSKRDAILERIEQLLTSLHATGVQNSTAAYQGTLTLLRAVYGPNSSQELHLRDVLTAGEKWVSDSREETLREHVNPGVRGTLVALKGDILAGVVTDLTMRGSGEVLGDMLGLARDALAAGGDGRGEKNVAAVLAAAAFEDAIRRIASARAGVQDRPKLESVVGTLKGAGILTGPSVAISTSYLKFRNDALHADWELIQPATVASCIAFVEGLLLEHFS